MAKRFTDTNKYKKAFMRGLPGAYKLFWDFLYHDCDHCGIWIVDFDIAQTYVGKDMPISREKALELFNEDEIRIVVLAGGKKWFIPSFIEFQYGHLSEKNRAHITVISTLKKLNLIDVTLKLQTDIKPLISPFQGDKDKDKEQEQEIEQDFGKSENLLAPQMVAAFKKSYPTYPEDKKSDYPACFQIAQKIAKSKGWTQESITNGRMEDAINFWTEIVQFSKTDNWFSTRSISDFNKEYQRLIQKMTNGQQSTIQSSKPFVTKHNAGALELLERGKKQYADERGKEDS